MRSTASLFNTFIVMSSLCIDQVVRVPMYSYVGLDMCIFAQSMTVWATRFRNIPPQFEVMVASDLLVINDAATAQRLCLVGPIPRPQPLPEVPHFPQICHANVRAHDWIGLRGLPFPIGEPQARGMICIDRVDHFLEVVNAARA